ncbi:hypothetical protein L228DRAFT_242059 [Xylona heveae TC161]|uniref:DUF4291 domain-containing protein n=1 Tax=Xylona heveae (strain CBS 132557 / TC161) TaxID=1328760 RepID=A0A164ZF13_XYLHT|nr:hypothetical protein L228DRAFT_242059 [Xylona heveae TC161]KZF19021.1 hypothetical protein L228DRAFT_242059 [Xylona heveae TC161]
MSAFREVRASFTAETITVYQAYPAEIAEPALRAGNFVPPFKRERMTWIKPSFLWMAYRCGWATKLKQERVLAVEITRQGFEWALAHSCLSHHTQNAKENSCSWEEHKRASPVRVQWDPERDLLLHPLPYRSIQIGLSGTAVDRYLDEWIVSIRDVTFLMKEISDLMSTGQREAARAALPLEHLYPLPDDIAQVVEASSARAAEESAKK